MIASPGEGARENREPDDSSEQLCSSPQGRDHTKTKDQMRTMTGFEVIEKHTVTREGTTSERLAVLLGKKTVDSCWQVEPLTNQVILN